MQNTKVNSIIQGSNKSLNFFDEDFYIHGEFDETISTDIIPHLIKEINRKENVKGSTIKFFINSNGGVTNYLKNLLTLIKVAKSKNITIETHVYGIAYSCGSLLAVSGTKGHRYVGEHAEHLCHLGAGWSFSTTDEQLERNNERMKAHFDFVRDIYKKNCKIKNLNNLLKDDLLFFRGENLIKQGLADHIL